MSAFKIEPASNGNIWVTLPYSEEGVARVKKIPGHRWNPERKQWLLPDTPQTRAALAEIIALKSKAPSAMLTVAPKRAETRHKAHAPFVRGKPLTTDPPHPFIKQVDDELVLRGMAYGTRKSYGQHLRTLSPKNFPAFANQSGH